jgi:hypothetical protein
MQAFSLCGYISGEVSKTDAEEYTKCVSAEKNAASVGFDEEYTCHVSGEPDREYGTYEPVLLETENLRDIDVRPKEIKEQLLKDIKKYGIRLTRPTKYLK